MSPYRVAIWLAFIASIIAVENCVAEANENEDEAEDPSEKKFLTFDEYKKAFHKVYASPSEELRRRKIYDAKMARTFVSIGEFKSNSSSSYLSLNEMSDWTEGEREETLMKSEVYLESLISEHPEEIESLQELLEKEDDKSTDDFDEDDTATRHSSGKKKKFNFGLLNPKKLITKFVKYLDNGLNTAVMKYYTHYLDLMGRFPEYNPNLPDEIFVDHRKSRCLNGVRHQERCGACYIFSTIALYEWAYCRLKGKRVGFSEQYPINCGYTYLLMEGCNGGVETAVAKFIRHKGIEFRDTFDYVAMDEQCPYKNNEHLGKNQMGAFKLEGDAKLMRISYGQLEKQLKISPVIITLFVSKSFLDYGGGIDDGAKCLKEIFGLHSMLVVGSGRENGHEFWILRNSHGMFWGESGYYRLRKKSSCYFIFGRIYTIEAFNHKRFNDKSIDQMKPLEGVKLDFKLNPEHDESLLMEEIKRQRVSGEF